MTSTDDPHIAEPPLTHNEKGEPRSVGVEIEFAGISVLDSADLVVETYGGIRKIVSDHRVLVENTRLGDFKIELDAAIAHKLQDNDNAEHKDDFEKISREVIGYAIAGPVPTEVVFPPVPWHDLDELDPLIEELRDAGAEGTRDAVYYGFGVHLNQEVAEQTADYTLRHLQAYLILEDWLRGEINIDPMRRVLPHIDPFPPEYALKLMNPDYRPDMQTLIADYLHDNPTRNRGLDMTPLFRFLDEDTVVANLDDVSLINARPTFHYRLPNAELDDPEWSFITDWNRWVEVEKLAANTDQLHAKMKSYGDWLRQPRVKRWLDQLGDWLNDD